MTSSTATAPATAVAARAIDATKVYGAGDTEVRALDGVTVDFQAERFTAIMGPSGSGKSTLMHCVAGLDSLTSGHVSIDGTDLTTLNDKALTQLRRDQVGFVFQSFNLIPTLSALENITLPMDLAGRKPDQAWLDSIIDTVEPRATASTIGPASSRAASSSGSRSPGPSLPARRSSSLTNRPGTSTRGRARRSSASCSVPSPTSARRS